MTALGFLLSLGCASAPREAAEVLRPTVVAVAEPRPAAARQSAPVQVPPGAPREASSVGKLAVNQQVAHAQRAILLYERFLERAGDDPQYAVAVKRSREAIADLRDTLIFLQETSSPSERR